MNKLRNLGACLLTLALTVAVQAQTTPTDYGAELNDNLDVINTIWGTVATIMIGVALVTVGVRFFRKTK